MTNREEVTNKYILLADSTTKKKGGIQIIFRYVLLFFPFILFTGTTLGPGIDRVFGSEKIPVIFDTDMDTDCDDLGAMAILHSLADRNEIDILATTCSSKYEYSGPCIQAVNQYYGRGDLPIGVPKGAGASVVRGSRYAKAITERFKPDLKTNAEAPSAVSVLRRALVGAKDRSVVVVTVGYLTNMADLLDSEADSISSLSGKELVAKKVKRYVCMGGRYPEQLSYGEWGNFMPDPSAVQKTARNWPGPITYSGDGEDVLTGYSLNRTSVDNPVRFGYQLYLKSSTKSRPSWDPITLLYAVRPDASYWRITSEGYNHLFENGTNQWRKTPDSKDILVQIKESEKETVRNILEELMTEPPQAGKKASR